MIVFENVSRFYGEVLGVNSVSLTIPPGITSLVGPNGSGKTTLMNLMTGLLQPTRGKLSVLGATTNDPETMFRSIGYCTQFDAFPKGLTGYQFVSGLLALHGWPKKEVEERAWKAIERVNLVEAANRKVHGYSKGMRQRIKLAQSMAHNPRVMVLDEPLNGLDPMARSETIALFRELAAEGRWVIVSSHILHEVDKISDQVILLSHGYVVAEGQIQGVRSEVTEQPMQILVRCNLPARVAALLFTQDHVVEVKMHDDGRGLLVRTKDSNKLFAALQDLAVEEGFELESFQAADDDVESVYQYLIGTTGGAA